MGRRARGQDALEEAKKLLRTAKTADELRAAQAVVFPLELGLSLGETALAVGRSPGSVARLRSNFINREGLDKTPMARGGSRRKVLTTEQEVSVVKDAVLKYRKGAFGVTVIKEVRAAIQRESGRPVSLSAAYVVLNRAIKTEIFRRRARTALQLLAY